MSTKRQFEFVKQHLRIVAASVGVDIDESEEGLMEVHNRVFGWEQDLGETGAAQADRLMELHGQTDAGLLALVSLGFACYFFDGDFWLDREWEPVDSFQHSKEKSLCDFAIAVGEATERCNAYRATQEGAHNKEGMQSWFAELGAKGADVRNAPYKKLKEWVIEQYQAGRWSSANEAGHDLAGPAVEHGRKINAALKKSNAQRTIAGWIREYLKSLS